MSKETFTRFDAAQYLESDEDMRLYLQISLEENGIKGFQYALGVIARAKGMSEIAKKAGLSRQNLYKALSQDANPRIDTLDKVARALDVKVTTNA